MSSDKPIYTSEIVLRDRLGIVFSPERQKPYCQAGFSHNTVKRAYNDHNCFEGLMEDLTMSNKFAR